MQELYHHGILGQKWGVRRFQNPDGSLTEKGKKRYAKDLANEWKRGHDGNSQFSKKVQEQAKKTLSKDDVKKLQRLQDAWTEAELEEYDYYDGVDKYGKEREALVKKYKKDSVLWEGASARDYEKQEEAAYEYAESVLHKRHKNYESPYEKTERALNEYKKAMEEITNKMLYGYGNMHLGIKGSTMTLGYEAGNALVRSSYGDTDISRWLNDD